MGGMMLYLPAYESTGKDGRRDISSVLGYENKYGQSEPTKRHVKTSSRMVLLFLPTAVLGTFGSRKDTMNGRKGNSIVIVYPVANCWEGQEGAINECNYWTVIIGRKELNHGIQACITMYFILLYFIFNQT